MGEALDDWMIFIPFPLILALGKLFDNFCLSASSHTALTVTRYVDWNTGKR